MVSLISQTGAHFNKLLAFEKMTFKNDELREKAAALIVSDVVDKLTEEEQQEVKDYFRAQ